MNYTAGTTHFLTQRVILVERYFLCVLSPQYLISNSISKFYFLPRFHVCSLSDACKAGGCTSLFYKCKIPEIAICFWKLKLWKYHKINTERMKRGKFIRYIGMCIFFKTVRICHELSDVKYHIVFLLLFFYSFTLAIRRTNDDGI